MGYKERHVIISRHNAYHGSTMAGASLGGMSGMHEQGGLPIPGIVHIGQPNYADDGKGMTEHEFGLKAASWLEDKILEVGKDKVAAFIGEPVQGAGGVVIPPASYWPEIQRICDKYGILLIADEVITAFGRTGAWTGSRLWGVKPDMMSTAKAITNGYFPFGAVMISDEVAQVFESNKGPLGSIGHGYTYSGHPVGAAAALATLKETRRLNVAANAAARGEELLAGLKKLQDKHELVGDVRGKGLMCALELVSDRATKSGAAKDVVQKVQDATYEAGVLVRTSGTNVIMSPPLIVTAEDVQTMLTALDAGLTAARG
jgi:adenosylmethionine-8-amino-7-oxononanoate aminotransferase